MYSFVTLPNSKSILKLKRNLNEESIPTEQIGTTLLKGLLTTTVRRLIVKKRNMPTFTIFRPLTPAERWFCGRSKCQTGQTGPHPSAQTPSISRPTVSSANSTVLHHKSPIETDGMLFWSEIRGSNHRYTKKVDDDRQTGPVWKVNRTHTYKVAFR